MTRPAGCALGALFATMLVVGSLTMGSAPPAVAAPGESNTPLVNPDLVKACGIDISVILDESGSVKNYKTDVQRAFRSFTSALRNTGSRLAVSEFSTVARLPLASPATGEYTAVTDDTIRTIFDPYINNGYNPNGSTNWEDGFRVARYQLPRPSGTQPHLVVFITDGNPNKIIRTDRVTYDPGNPSVTQNEYENKVPLNDNEVSNSGEDPASARAVSNANGLKLQGSHVLTIAVGDGLSGTSTLNRLIRVSGPDVFGGGSGSTQPAFDISTTDVYRETDFTRLEQALREAAFQLCAPSVTVRKLVDLTPDTGVGDAVPAAGYDLTAQPSPSPSRWVLPSGASGSTATSATDANGFANFQWEYAAPQASAVTITEQDPAGIVPNLVYRPDLTTCTVRTPDAPDDAVLVTTPLTDGRFGFRADIPSDAIVTCTIYNVLPPTSSIVIEKATNGFDADTPGDAPTIPVGDPVDWTYAVTNTGTVTLDPVVVADVPAETITCPKTVLVPGESMTCSATGVAVAPSVNGPYSNIATVTGTPPATSGLPPATDDDPSHYIGAAPSIDIEKATNGPGGTPVDADSAPGPYIGVGDQVTWTYVVTNEGNQVLSNVTVVDDTVGQITCPRDTLTVAPDNDATMTCTATGTAVAGQYRNVATVEATDPTSATVTDADVSHYFGAVPSVVLQKLTNGEDADVAPGPMLEIGQNVLWIYLVRNDGNIALSSFAVTDDQVGAVTCPKVVLRPSDVATCFATGTAAAGQYANVGTVTATDLAGTVVGDTDPSHYFGADPGIQVEKSTNGPGGTPVDADVAPGPAIAVGDQVTWTYTITNTGNVGLTGVLLADSMAGVSPTCPQNALAVGASMTCTATGTATAGQYENTAYAIGIDPVGQFVSDTDPSHYYGAAPGILVEKSTNGVDADEPIAPDGLLNGPFLLVGSAVDWTYTVTNTGNQPLTDVTVTDVPVQTITCPTTTLAPGATMTCTASGTAVEGQYLNTATATGVPDQNGSPGQPVSDTDPSHYYGYRPEITLQKSTNGVDADAPTGPSVPVGDQVDWTYTLTNTGNVSIFEFLVTDSDPSVNVVCPAIGRLAPGASVTCAARGTALEGQYENTATVVALDFFEDELTASDPSHYFGVRAAIDIEKSTNGVDADVAPGPDITQGETVTWTYVVTNVGNVDLDQLVVTDDKIGMIACPVTSLVVGQSTTCTALGVAVLGQYVNVATATAVATGQIAVVDTDPSHYNGVVGSLPPQPPTTLPTVPPTIPPGGLPVTGSNGIATILACGLAALLGGVVLLRVRRRATD